MKPIWKLKRKDQCPMPFSGQSGGLIDAPESCIDEKRTYSGGWTGRWMVVKGCSGKFRCDYLKRIIIIEKTVKLVFPHQTTFTKMQTVYSLNIAWWEESLTELEGESFWEAEKETAENMPPSLGNFGKLPTWHRNFVKGARSLFGVGNTIICQVYGRRMISGSDQQGLIE